MEGIPRWAGFRVAIVLAILSLGLTACDNARSPAAQPRPTPPAGATASADREAADRRAAEQAYRQFWQVSWTFDQHYAQNQWRDVLGAVAVDPELSLLLSGAQRQRQHGITLYGAVIPHPTVPPVNGKNTATVRDCQDASHSGQADAKTGKAHTVGVARNPVVATLARGEDGRWRVSQIRYPGGRCV
jgi:hypothetical protein